MEQILYADDLEVEQIDNFEVKQVGEMNKLGPKQTLILIRSQSVQYIKFLVSLVLVSRLKG